MVGRALSEQVKHQAHQRAENLKYQEALDEYRHEQEKPVNQRRGLRPIATTHQVCYRTLGNLANGGMTMSAFNASKCKLSCPEERVLVDFILASADRGIPLTRDNITLHANAIITRRDKPGEPVGVSWVGRFLVRYHDELQTHWSKPLATERARSLNGESVKEWFKLVEELVVKRGIKADNIYGMDESGFPPSNQGTQRVVGRRGTKTQHKVTSANRENVTAIVTICADGSALKPTVIFKGQNFLRKWGENNVSGASYASLTMLFIATANLSEGSVCPRTAGLMGPWHISGLRRILIHRHARKLLVKHVSCWWMAIARITQQTCWSIAQQITLRCLGTHLTVLTLCRGSMLYASRR